jgi:hypothetical protein
MKPQQELFDFSAVEKPEPIPDRPVDSPDPSPVSLLDQIESRIENGEPALALIRPALQQEPTSFELLVLGAVAALLEERPDQALAYVKRLHKRYLPSPPDNLLLAVAHAQKRNWFQAKQSLQLTRRFNLRSLASGLPGGDSLLPRLRRWLATIETENRLPTAIRQRKQKRTIAADHPSIKTSPQKITEDEPDAADALPRFEPRITLSFSFPQDIQLDLDGQRSAGQLDWLRMRNQIAELGLLQGFDELLCLQGLHNVDTYWYQVETVRKVLKQFRGRVLLADEVGLGKTIEAGLEYS